MIATLVVLGGADRTLIEHPQSWGCSISFGWQLAICRGRMEAHKGVEIGLEYEHPSLITKP
jgi:hypothetical protein